MLYYSEGVRNIIILKWKHAQYMEYNNNKKKFSFSLTLLHRKGNFYTRITK